MSDYSRLIELFEQLISFKTVTGNEAEAGKCLDFAEKIFHKHGLFINRYSSNGFESLVATSRDTKTPALMLQAHIDVVPAEDALFTMQGEGSKLCGRGVFDMKYAAACYLHLVEELAGSVGEYDFGIMLTSDEETGGLNGVKHLLDQGYSCDVCILPDGGDNWRLETAAKGGWQVDVIALGKSAHGSRPWDGQNAAVKLMDFLGQALQLAPAKHHTDTTMVVSKLQAGTASNQVPSEATASLDIRFLHESDYKDISLKMGGLMKKMDISMVSDRYVNPIELDVTLDAIQMWEQVVSEVRGQHAPDGYALSFGASDARFFAEVGIPTIVTRPDGGGMHGDDEWIDEAGLYQFADCLRKYLEVSARPNEV